MKLALAVAAVAATAALGLMPAVAQNAPPSTATPAAASPQTATPADAQGTTPQVVRPRGASGSDCAWKAKNLSS